jgi:Kdo2-lipid IVA lauroyltransferase/acyltransferase
MPAGRPVRGARERLKPLLDGVVGLLTVGALKTLRLIDRRAMANLSAAVVRTAGPWLKEHRIGRDNLAAAFPEKSAGEIEAILRGVWDNLGRVAAEFAHIDRMQMHDPARPDDDILYSRETLERFLRLRDDGRPAMIFTAHLANWELPAIVAARYGLNAHVLFRRPNIGAVSDAVLAIRAGTMGTLVPTSLDAPGRLVEALAAGGHVAMLVDQYYGLGGVEVTFFGRVTRANPLIARLARHVDCPIHGVRMVRLPGRNQFRADLTEAVAPVRDASGAIDVAATMQAITNVIEGWVREHPEQWLWLHRRWR